MSLPKPTLSATVDGVVTNRVEVRKPRPAKAKRQYKNRYRVDKSRIGGGAVQRCISATEAEWLEIDAAAQRLMMSRSDFVRHAARELIRRLAASADATARGCGARSASCTSR